MTECPENADLCARSSLGQMVRDIQLLLDDYVISITSLHCSVN